eukprot:CAMPEP_0206458276 /NCGR_PEP_ID=MMETSP0324_2-20121206/23469_1 /ASSEMBLY_ACC=CAM_ASM_000836 /TAXON_ID=2866 /ORGANISM="Crypthecodinium cohnii, Strain Seligo" /LENGTH=335 /DNA_ID=CAMNT_0053929575 /DNA_START=534 /DNA_END=1542 /DNA_ORIENTATION=-
MSPSASAPHRSPLEVFRQKSSAPSSNGDDFATPRETLGKEGDVPDRAESGNPPFTAEFSPWQSLPYGKPAVQTTPSKPYWTECDATVFDVRNICYKQTKEKVPSEVALYDCVGMDMIRDHQPIVDVMSKLPTDAEGRRKLPASPAGAPTWDPSWGVPRVVIINCLLPYKAGYLMAAHPEDDGGLSVCNYFVLSKRESEILANNQASPALSLWKRFVANGQSSKDGTPLKVLGRIEDLARYEVPESFHRFNNKPVLLTKSSRVITTHLPEVLEIDYDVRSWVYPARSALASYHHRAAEAELEVGYLIEGKSDDELPEQILGCCTLYDMDILQAKWL